eukprot:CAMPEP_0179000332 /NCGR_PEP_ID=MMETSP0795-20121207/10607_1 /TAXON_ID=88552 /ORGANISM="Amoebophrya sp., Strain Ameob2" /LENGTH=1026 /DNA_ID=CAMNT_0020693305 /DNA_START=60 /DNA_END=3141 /DNA_ORIENTATION=-
MKTSTCATAPGASSSTEERYIEINVHPLLEKLGEALAASLPDEVDRFVLEWLEDLPTTPSNTNAGSSTSSAVNNAMGAGRAPVDGAEGTTGNIKSGNSPPTSTSAVTKQTSVQQRRDFVQREVSPLLWQITYDCLTNRPRNVRQFLIDKWRKKIHRRSQTSAFDSCDDMLSDDDDNMLSEQEVERMRNLMTDRRIGVSAEKMTSAEMQNYEAPKFAKTETQRAELKSLIKRSKDGKMHMLFGLVSDGTLEKVVDAMEVVRVKKKEHVIRQGEEGDFFYIVQNGKFDIYVSGSKVFEAGPGFAFGELALLYNAPRSASIQASQDSEVWRLDRVAFRMLVVMAQEEKMREYVNFLQKVNIFETLSNHEVARLAEVVQEEDFEEDEAIIEQGAVDNSMFIVLSGSCVACIQKEGEEELEVMRYGPADYFGEIALLNATPRQASVYATESNTVLLMVDEPSFRRILGPVRDILKRKISLYQAYDDFLQKSDAEAEENIKNSGNKPTSSKQLEKKGPQVKKYRKIKAAEAENAKFRESLTVGGSSPTGGARGFTSTTLMQEKEPETLKEKIAADFRRPELVKVSSDFAIQEAAFSVISELKPNQTFKDNKPLKILISTAAGGFAVSSSKGPSSTSPAPVTSNVSVSKQPTTSPSKEEGQSVAYTYSAPSQLKGPTLSSVVIQKGQKHNFDPTPNQDNLFFHTLKNGLLLLGVCDGHGPFGHIVSLRVSQTLPHFLMKLFEEKKVKQDDVTSAAETKNATSSTPQEDLHGGNQVQPVPSSATPSKDRAGYFDWESAFHQAFDKAMTDLREFANAHGMNFDVSGSTCSVLVLHEQKLHLGWVGDSNVLVASYNRHDSTEIFTTRVHAPEAERERIEQAGEAEVREIAEGSYRIYLKGTNVPGLTMSRAFGDFLLQGKGVTHLPDYKCLTMQPGDEWFSIVATDGIWEFLSSEEVVKFAAKKLRLKGVRETNKALIDSSRKRWAHVEGDYCDDIGSIVTMFNGKPLPENYSVHVEEDYSDFDPPLSQTTTGRVK